MNLVKRVVKKALNRFGFDVVRLPQQHLSNSPFHQLHVTDRDIIDIEALSEMSSTIPGMITPEAGKFLFSLCYMMSETGDVVEIGSWQGRSTVFLAHAVKSSGNGNFYAIDHFAGNEGKEEFYAVDGRMDNLKDKFKSNISAFGLTPDVNLLDMPNDEASKKLENIKIRFLFIDGDHTKAGVKQDIKLWFPKLVKGAIVVFDDYFDEFPGLTEAVDELIREKGFSRVFYFRNSLVIRI